MCLINASQYATNFVSLLSQLISQSSSINSTRSWLWGLTVYITIDSCFNFDVQQVQVQRLWVSEVTNWSSDHRLELPFDDAWRTIWVGDVTHRCVSGRLVGVGCHLYDIVTSYDREKAWKSTEDVQNPVVRWKLQCWDSDCLGGAYMYSPDYTRNVQGAAPRLA